MAKPTLADYFGDASLVSGDPAAIETFLDEKNVSATNPAFVVTFSSLAPAGLSNVQKFSDPEVIFASFIKFVSLWTRGDTTETNAIELGAARPSITQRNGQQRKSFNYDCTIYGSVVDVTDIDPDDII
ncbi:MAG: hypothetical protein ACRC62_19650 [Microcoleus sp.]